MTAKLIFDASAIVACSLMAVLVSIDRHRRLGTGMAVGVVASVAGGSLRDICLGVTPVFWIREPWQIYFALAATAGMYLCMRKARVRTGMLLVPDSLSLAIPAAIAARSALTMGDGPAAACAVGIVAGMTGGILRDLMCEREPAVLKRELYGVAALAGSLAVCLLDRMRCAVWLQLMIGTTVGAVTRMAAILGHISVGRLILREPNGRGSR